MPDLFILRPSVLWISIWFLLNVSLTLLNKSLMVFYGFDFPVIMSFVHMAISTFLSYLSVSVFHYNPMNEKLADSHAKADFEKTVTNRILLLSLLFTLNIVFGNTSLKYCSVAFVQVLKAIIPLITMILSTIVLKSRYTPKHYVACLVICIGVAFSCYGEINLTVYGFFITFIGCFLSSAKSVSIKYTLSGAYELHSSDLVTRMSPIAAIEMFGLIFSTGEDQAILQSQKYSPGAGAVLGVIVSGVIAYFLNLTNFLATYHTSPLTVTIVGCVKQVLTIVLSVIIFDKKMTATNAIGILVTTAGSLWYSLIRQTKRKEPQPEALVDQQKRGILIADPKASV